MLLKEYGTSEQHTYEVIGYVTLCVLLCIHQCVCVYVCVGEGYYVRACVCVSYYELMRNINAIQQHGHSSRIITDIE